MKKLECIIFDVAHGFCAFIKSPNDFGLLYDAGGKQFFSPVKYIRSKYCDKLKYHQKRRIAKLVVSHLHVDHFSDVGSFSGYEDPKTLLRDKETLKFIDEKIKNARQGDPNIDKLVRFKKFQKKYSQDVEKKPDWGFDYFSSKQLSYSHAEEVSSCNEKIINNRSYVTVIGYAGKRILLPGDIETEGWEKYLSDPKRSEHVNDIDFFIASHHGHKSGFTNKIIEHTGKPDLFIVSAKSGDNHIDSSYSKQENSNGFLVNNEATISRMISTRQKNQSIKISIYENGHSEVEFIETPDNLNTHQANLRTKKTARMTKGWAR